MFSYNTIKTKRVYDDINFEMRKLRDQLSLLLKKRLITCGDN